MASVFRSDLSRRRVLLGIVAGGFAVAGWRIWRRIPPDYAGDALSAPEAFEGARDNALLLIDIRTPREWHASGVGAGATPLDMRRPDFETALRELAGGDPHRPIALICARGVRSARLANRLAQAGFSNIIDVPEGMLGSKAGPGWVRRELPVVVWEKG